jgi:hypothetical protein
MARETTVNLIQCRKDKLISPYEWTSSVLNTIHRQISYIIWKLSIKMRVNTPNKPNRRPNTIHTFMFRLNNYSAEGTNSFLSVFAY